MTRDAGEAILTLLASRSPNATICPSEVARALSAEGEWRAEMPAVHSAVDRLVGEGAIRLSWKGREMPSREGPYRIHGGAVQRE